MTDGIDGYLARKRDQITTMGILLDPIADKLLIAAAFIVLVQISPILVPAWVAIIVIGREFLVSGLRSIAASEGFTIGGFCSAGMNEDIPIGIPDVKALASVAFCSFMAFFNSVTVIGTQAMRKQRWAGPPSPLEHGSSRACKCRWAPYDQDHDPGQGQLPVSTIKAPGHR